MLQAGSDQVVLEQKMPLKTIPVPRSRSRGGRGQLVLLKEERRRVMLGAVCEEIQQLCRREGMLFAVNGMGQRQGFQLK